MELKQKISAFTPYAVENGLMMRGIIGRRMTKKYYNRISNAIPHY